MKSFLSYKCAFSLLFVAFVAVFVSCDQIGEGERYIAVTPVDTAGADTTGGVVPIRRSRKGSFAMRACRGVFRPVVRQLPCRLRGS